MARLDDREIAARLKDLEGWRRDGDAIGKEFTFESFPAAIAFIVRLAFDAEAADHHPDLMVSYRRVTVRFSTHSAGGITAKDFDGAHRVETQLQSGA